MMRLLLFPDSNESFKVFARLHTHQTSMLIARCGHLLEFKQWLCFIRAIEYDPYQQAKVLLELIKCKLDLRLPADYLEAEDAVKQLTSLEPSDDGDMDMDGREGLLTYGVASQQNILLKLQKAFCTRQFSQSTVPVDEAVRVFAGMNPATGFPKMLGYSLARDLLEDCDEALPRCRNIQRSIKDEQQRAAIHATSLDMEFVLNVAELAEQMGKSRTEGYQGTLIAFENLLDLKVDSKYFKIVLEII